MDIKQIKDEIVCMADELSCNDEDLYETLTWGFGATLAQISEKNIVSIYKELKKEYACMQKIGIDAYKASISFAQKADVYQNALNAMYEKIEQGAFSGGISWVDFSRLFKIETAKAVKQLECS